MSDITAVRRAEGIYFVANTADGKRFMSMTMMDITAKPVEVAVTVVNNARECRLTVDKKDQR